MKSDIFLKYINRYKYTILISLFVLINFVTLNNVPWGDDYPFVFESYIKNAPSPFSFWNPYSDYFKSWPVAYSFLWSLLQLFDSNVFYFRASNLIIHIFNSVLVYRLTSDVFKISDERKRFIITALFMFHPISLGTINWIFQIKTLLSLFFGLLTIICINQIPNQPKKASIKSIVFFFLAINAKIAVVLLPIYLFYRRNIFKNKKHFIILFLIFSSISSYYGLINIKGINAIWEERKNIEKSIIEYSDIGKENNTIEAVNERVQSQNDTKTLTDEIKRSFDSFKLQILKPQHFAEKGLISLFTLGRYITHSFGFNIFSIVYEKNSESLYAITIFSYSIITFITLWILFYSRYIEPLILCLCFYIPISGLFYVPYMKISYISDHWFYLALPFLLICIVKVFPKKLTYILLIVIMAQSVYSTTQFSTSEKAIAHSLKYYNNTFVKEYFIKVSMHLEDYKSAYDYTVQISNDYSIKKDEIINAKFVINAFYNKNKRLWFDTKDFVALRYSEGNLVEMENILSKSLPYEHEQEKKLLNHLIKLSLNVFSDDMEQDILNNLTIGTKPSHKKN